VTEHQVRNGPDRFMSYVAGEDTANGVPEHELSASDVEAINESLQLNEGDIVLLKAQFGQYTVSCMTPVNPRHNYHILTFLRVAARDSVNCGQPLSTKLSQLES